MSTVRMRHFRPMLLVAVLGALSASAGDALGQVDTSNWKCTSCPYEKPETSGAVEVGAGAVSDDSQKFGDYTGLEDQGAYLALGGNLRYRGDEGYYASLDAADLGLDVRTVEAQGGRDGLFGVRVGYAEIPHWLSEGAATPFLGVGGSTLTLPGGYPQPTTAQMPLAATLQPVDLEFKRKSLGGAASLILGPAWSARVDARHDVRDGTRRAAGSFFSTASHLALPVDDVTDQLEASASYGGRRLLATVAYQGSQYRDGPASLTWSNPFTPVVSGADAGQLALAPDNQFNQVMATIGYEFLPRLHASGDIAWGQMTQNDAYLPATLNASLAPTVPPLPAASLNGHVDTFNASARITATPTDRLRFNASYARDERDNKTDSLSYPAVSTDMFLGTTPRVNQPFDFTQDRYKLDANYRGPLGLNFGVGVDYDEHSRTLQEVENTRETTVWGRVAGRPLDNVSVELKLAHGDRSNSTYGVAEWIDPPENPLLRKYNLADRQRDTVGVRTDVLLGQSWNLGLEVDWSNDDYSDTTIGLTGGDSLSVGGDISVAVSDDTRVHALAQFERSTSDQAGSQVFAAPDWQGSVDDDFEVVGIGVTHQALKGKLELSADAHYSHSGSDVTVDNGAVTPPFPTATTKREDLRLQALYHLRDNVSLIGSYWYENYRAEDWAYDGVFPDTVPNLLAFGEQPPRYHVNVLMASVRYGF